jgi:hypothetical protein
MKFLWTLWKQKSLILDLLRPRTKKIDFTFYNDTGRTIAVKLQDLGTYRDIECIMLDHIENLKYKTYTLEIPKKSGLFVKSWDDGMMFISYYEVKK